MSSIHSNGGGGFGSGGSGAAPKAGTDPNGMERLAGETDEQYIARQTRLRDEAKARMAAKFGGGGMGGVGSGGGRMGGKVENLLLEWRRALNIQAYKIISSSLIPLFPQALVAIQTTIPMVATEGETLMSLPLPAQSCLDLAVHSVRYLRWLVLQLLPFKMRVQKLN